jgi:hypothetical protein
VEGAAPNEVQVKVGTEAAPPPVREYPEGELEVAVVVEALVPNPPKAGTAVVAAVNDDAAANTGAGGAAPTAPKPPIASRMTRLSCNC